MGSTALNPNHALATVNMGVVVTNLANSTAFYANVIGMDFITTIPITAAQSQSSGFAGGQAFNIHLYQTQGVKGATGVKLIEFEGTSAMPTQGGINDYAGINYLTFTFDQIAYQEVIDRAVKAGHLPLGNINTPEWQATYVRDPDGVFIELITFGSEFAQN